LPDGDAPSFAAHRIHEEHFSGSAVGIEHDAGQGQIMPRTSGSLDRNLDILLGAKLLRDE
jgi:hypothetical protein